MAKVLDRDATTALGLSLRIQGCVGPVTFRRVNKRTSIAYRERRRTSALTDKQLAHRVRFLRGYEQWNTLTDQQRADWTTAANRATTRQIGSHLFFRCWWVQDTHTVDMFKIHYNLDLLLPGP